jgi:hypothetical protein
MENETAGGVFQLLPLLILWALIIPPLWKITKRAGFSPWLSLLMLVPVVNLVALWVFSIKEWPALKNPE